MDRILRAAPDEEITIAVSYIIDVKAHIQVLIVLHRRMPRQVSAHTHAVIETLHTVALVLESADRAGDIEVPYPTGMGRFRSVVQRLTSAGIGIVLIVVIHTYVTRHFRLRLQTRTLGTYVDHAVQRRRTVQHR